MNDIRLLQHVRPDMLLRQKHVGAWLSGEGEAAVAARVERDKGHGGGRIAGAVRNAGLYAVLPERVQQKPAKIVVSHHPAERRVTALPPHRDRDVGRRAAGLSDIARRLRAGQKIDHHFTDRKNSRHVTVSLKRLKHEGK